MSRNVHLKGSNRQGSSPVDHSRALREKAEQTRRATVSDYFLHPVSGYINGDLLAFDCFCGEKQSTPFPTWINPGVVWQTECRECGKLVVVHVEGYLVTQRSVKV